jgi:hypothetical protein
MSELGLPLQLILLSWLFKYGYVLLEQVAHGAREPPVLAIALWRVARAHRFETYDWLLQRLRRLDDQRLASRLAQD